MEEIKQTIQKLLDLMNLKDAEISIKKNNFLKDKEVLNVNIELDPKEAKAFFEEGGIGLSALQHLVRVLLFKKDSNRGFLILDINKHKKKREEILTELALETAKKVRRTKKAVILESMPAYERRFVHLKLAEYPDIVTESIGEEPERKIVVRLYP